MTGYELSRNWFDFCFENTDMISPNHTAIYFFAIEHNNRLGWKNKFGFPTGMAMDAVGIRNYRTYKKAFDDLVDWGFFKLLEKSKNQYSANVIALVKNTKANTKALDKAIQKHSTKQVQSIASIDKPINQLTIKPENIGNGSKSRPSSFQELEDYFFEKIGHPEIAKQQAEEWVDYYESVGYIVGSSRKKMQDWKATVRNWIRKMNKNSKNNGQQNDFEQAQELRRKLFGQIPDKDRSS